MEKKYKFLLRLFFFIWATIIFFIYYRQELIHNLDHLPFSLQDLIKKLLFIK